MKKEHIHQNFNLKDIILGGQDGLVNVLGVILGVAAATFQTKIVIIAGLAAAFTESISMAAVAYTSTETALSYYNTKLKKSKLINLLKEEYENPKKSAFVVGFSAIIGSLIPLLPFFFLSVKSAIMVALVLSALALFITGMIRARLTIGNQFRSGLEMLIIGMLAALAGYLVGVIFSNIDF
ncbi:MAG: VIT1/CCC1 transporter family protein, partial [Nanoarchaeota archaeon]